MEPNETQDNRENIVKFFKSHGMEVHVDASGCMVPTGEWKSTRRKPQPDPRPNDPCEECGERPGTYLSELSVFICKRCYDEKYA